MRQGFTILTVAIGLCCLSGCVANPSQNEDLLASDKTVAVEKSIQNEKPLPLQPVKPLKQQPRFKAGKMPKPLCEKPQPVYAQHVLKPAERVSVTVFREEDLTGIYEISVDGWIAFPLIGNIKAAGMTATQLQEKIKALLAKGYLVDPQVHAVTARCMDEK